MPKLDATTPSEVPSPPYPACNLKDARKPLTPEEWANDIGVRAGEKARELAASGVTRADLLAWADAQKDRTWEFMQDRIDRLTRDAQVEQSRR